MFEQQGIHRACGKKNIMTVSRVNGVVSKIGLLDLESIYCIITGDRGVHPVYSLLVIVSFYEDYTACELKRMTVEKITFKGCYT